MPLATQIILALVLGVLVAGAVLALIGFPRNAQKAPLASRDRVRALSGFLAVLVSDVAIVIVVIWAVGKVGGLDKASAVALVSGAFTAVSTMTTAYLGLKAVSNTAQILHEDPGSTGTKCDGTTPPKSQSGNQGEEQNKGKESAQTEKKGRRRPLGFVRR